MVNIYCVKCRNELIPKEDIFYRNHNIDTCGFIYECPICKFKIEKIERL